MRFSGIFQTISFTVRKRFVNAFLPSPYTVSKPSKNAPKTAKKIRNACGKNPHPLPPSCGSQSPKNRFVRPFFGILQVLALKTPARWPFSHSLCVFTKGTAGRGRLPQGQGIKQRRGLPSFLWTSIGPIVPHTAVSPPWAAPKPGAEALAQSAFLILQGNVVSELTGRRYAF